MSTRLGIFVAYISILPCVLLFTNGVIEKVLIYLHALGVTCIIYFLINFESIMNNDGVEAKKDEMYGLRHLLFNLDLEPKTLWFNMGLWEDDSMRFPEACEKLVHAVVSNFNIKPDSTILDVGFGCGDSSIVLAEQYKAKVTGITNEYTQWKVATDRVKENQDITLLHGSANDLDTLITGSFDYIISVDSAYHYDTRWSFLESCLKHLNPRGMIGLYDLTIHPNFKSTASVSQKQAIQLICNALNIPLKNLVTAEEYRSHLEVMGYKQISVQELERGRIFGGLSRAFQRQYETAMKNGVGVSVKNTMILKVSSYLFGVLAERPWIVPVLVECTKE